MSAAASVASRIELGERSYRVLVGSGLSHRIGEILAETMPDASGCVVITSLSLDELYSAPVMSGLERLSPVKLIVPDGEDAKTWATAETVIGGLIGCGLKRSGAVVAFGGGAVGDLAGFTASVYLRGVRLIQFPTTLLSMVDSSIGGKTAVNHPGGKNLIGAFHQPSAVVIDPELLETLPVREIASGLAEAVKYGVIGDQQLFTYIEENAERLLSKDVKFLTHVIKASVAIKAGYVEKDERDDKGIRASLNLGHTLGHAVERLKSPEMRHGEVVSIGMVYATRLAAERKLMARKDAARLVHSLAMLGLPTEVPKLPADKLIALMRRDKKNTGEGIRFILPRGIGVEPVHVTVYEEAIRETLRP